MTLKTISALAVGGILAATPYSVGFDGQGVVRLNGACAQASSCSYASTYICSTHHNDYRDYRCATGCDAKLEEAAV